MHAGGTSWQELPLARVDSLRRSEDSTPVKCLAPTRNRLGRKSEINKRSCSGSLTCIVHHAFSLSQVNDVVMEKAWLQE